MNLLSSFSSFIKTENLFSKKDRLLLAVSGGIDSVVLCELCNLAGYTFAIAHCNFQLRGEESNEDEKFVQALAKKYGAEFFLKRFDTQTYADQNKLSIQVAARELRYGWFKDLLNNIKVPSNREAPNPPLYGTGALLTAHHADDNIETILMNFFKGSGINGLKGMLPKQFNIVRPLLFATKEDISGFARTNNLNYREDSSNNIDKYTRNYFRNQLIPGLEKVFPQVKQNLLENVTRFREIHEVYEAGITRLKKQLITPKGEELYIPVLKLLKTKPLTTVLYEIIREFGFSTSQVGEVEKLLHSESGKYIESATHRILLNRKWLIIAPLHTTVASNYLVKETDAKIDFPLGELYLQHGAAPGSIDKETLTAQVDASEIKFPLLVRKWKAGDYFYPLGMKHKKKLSRFFNDNKFSLLDREKTWVIESNKKIIWIIGKRIDDRFKLTASTSKTLRISLRPAK